MIGIIFDWLNALDAFFWRYIGFTIVIVSGIYFSFKSDFLQFKTLFKVRNLLKELQDDAKNSDHGTSPIKLFFTSIGGMVGIGNIAVAATAVSLGGPGSVIWMWAVSFAGMLIKYSDIFLGIKYRVDNDENGYDGGPMYYLQKAFHSKIPSVVVCILFCIYGIEVLQFTMLSDEIHRTLDIDKNYVVFFLLIFVLFSSVGGVKRVANLCSAVMPPFLIAYIAVGFYLFYIYSDEFFAMLPVIVDSAFNGHAAVGGAAGGGMLLAAQQGAARAVYSGDIGIGYDSILQSETRAKDPAKQARIAIIALFSDTFICTISCMITLVSGVWLQNGEMLPSSMVPEAIAKAIPNSEYLVLALLFIAGVTTITAYFVSGLKCAKFLSKKYGERIFTIIGTIAFIYFSSRAQTDVATIMSLSGGFLVFINLLGIIKLRNEINFKPVK